VTEELEQGTEAWRLARCGSLGASSLGDALAKTKSGWGASRANVLARLAIERLTGTPQDTYQNQAMRDGVEREPTARAAYQFERGVLVKQVGLIKHPTIAGTHASPDGLVADDGMIEIKAPSAATHLETLLGAPIPQKYQYQCAWQMGCTGRKWVDFTSYHPDFPEAMQLHITRINRDGRLIAELEDQVREFLAELEAKLAALTSRYGVSSQQEAA
jgi:putative phage-type endonuclease